MTRKVNGARVVELGRVAARPEKHQAAVLRVTTVVSSWPELALAPPGPFPTPGQTSPAPALAGARLARARSCRRTSQAARGELTGGAQGTHRRRTRTRTAR